MSGKALGWARDQQCSGGLAAKAVLILMADYADGEHKLYPSIATMAVELCCAERTVQRAVQSLVDDELVERDFRVTGTGKSTSSIYRLNIDKMPVRGGTESPLGVSESHPQGCHSDGVRVSQSHRHMIHQPIQGSSDELPLRARADESDAFRTAFAAWTGVDPLNTAPDQAWQAWQVAVVETGELRLLAAVRSFLTRAQAKPRDYPLRGLQTWLAERRFLALLPDASEADLRHGLAEGGVGGRRAFPGPDELRASLVARHGEACAVSWLDPCDWSPGRLTGTAAAVRWFTSTARQWLTENSIIIEGRRSHASG